MTHHSTTRDLQHTACLPDTCADRHGQKGAAHLLCAERRTASKLSTSAPCMRGGHGCSVTDEERAWRLASRDERRQAQQGTHQLRFNSAITRLKSVLSVQVSP